jgi:hypothetical protein
MNRVVYGLSIIFMMTMIMYYLHFLSEFKDTSSKSLELDATTGELGWTQPRVNFGWTQPRVNLVGRNHGELGYKTISSNDSATLWHFNNNIIYTCINGSSMCLTQNDSSDVSQIIHCNQDCSNITVTNTSNENVLEIIFKVIRLFWCRFMTEPYLTRVLFAPSACCFD